MEEKTTLGSYIRDVRKQKRLTQTELALAAGVSRTTISMIEHGNTTVTLSSLIAVTEALGFRVRISLVPKKL